MLENGWKKVAKKVAQNMVDNESVIKKPVGKLVTEKGVVAEKVVENMADKEVWNPIKGF